MPSFRPQFKAPVAKIHEKETLPDSVEKESAQVSNHLFVFKDIQKVFNCESFSKVEEEKAAHGDNQSKKPKGWLRNLSFGSDSSEDNHYVKDDLHVSKADPSEILDSNIHANFQLQSQIEGSQNKRKLSAMSEIEIDRPPKIPAGEPGWLVDIAEQLNGSFESESSRESENVGSRHRKQSLTPLENDTVRNPKKKEVTKPKEMLSSSEAMMSSSQASTSSDFELLGSQEVFSQLSCCQDQSQDSQPRRKSTDDVDFPITSKENPQVEVTPSPNTGDANSVLMPVMAVNTVEAIAGSFTQDSIFTQTTTNYSSKGSPSSSQTCQILDKILCNINKNSEIISSVEASKSLPPTNKSQVVVNETEDQVSTVPFSVDITKESAIVMLEHGQEDDNSTNEVELPNMHHDPALDDRLPSESNEKEPESKKDSNETNLGEQESSTVLSPEEGIVIGSTSAIKQTSQVKNIVGSIIERMMNKSTVESSKKAATSNEKTFIAKKSKPLKKIAQKPKLSNVESISSRSHKSGKTRKAPKTGFEKSKSRKADVGGVKNKKRSSSSSGVKSALLELQTKRIAKTWVQCTDW